MARAPINGSTLTWARRLAHLEIGELAAAAGVKPGYIEEFEAGTKSPTFRQLILIATRLDRPLGFFFAPAPTAPDVPETADFRGRSEEGVPAGLAREMRRANQYRDAMLDLAGTPDRQIRLGRIDRGNLPERATQLREQFGLTDSFVPAESQNNQVFNFWRGLLEENGVLVFQATRIALTVFRGLSIYHDTLPIILVNGADSAAGRTFTLFHEIAHLVNRTSGLCLLRETVGEEAIANGFAANFLMPEATVRRAWAKSADPNTMAKQLAGVFKVSELAAAVRLHTLGAIDDEELAEIRQHSDEQWDRARAVQKGRDGFVPTWRLRYRDLGPTYIGTIARALEDRRVDFVDATYLLNARLPIVEQLLSEYHRTGGAE